MKFLVGAIGFASLVLLSVGVTSLEASVHEASSAVSSGTDLSIEGVWVQGGLLTGSVVPGSVVTVLDKQPWIDSRGRFIFGLGRNTRAQVSVNVKSPTGQTRDYMFNVEQREYDIQKIEGIASKYVAPPASVTKRIKSDAAAVWSARQTRRETRDFAEGFKWPAEGRISGIYGSQRVFNGVPKRPHYGLDIAAPTGTVVVAPAAGLVTLVHDDMYYSGGTLIVDHGQGLSSTFIHLSKILVVEGEQVVQGQRIGEIGATGRATGPHLDWRMNWFDQRLDPQLLVAPR